ncbi:MAG: hypothetical protein EHM49_09165, partial [Deltaproteobacteria bacterium]
MQKIEVPFKPHKFQEQLRDSLERFTVFVCHRRFGKSTLMVNLLIRWALQTQKLRWKAAYIAPFYKQAKLIAWDYIKYYAGNIPGVHFNNAELIATFGHNGAQILLLGADNEQSLRGPYWDVAIFDEYAQVRPNAFPEIIRPALVDRKGWAIFIGTPKGKNHFWQLWQDVEEKKLTDWSRVMFKASETSILDPEELENARKTMAPEEYAQEFECSWEAALVGAYYGSFMADAVAGGRVTNVPYDPFYPVHTAWDLGLDDETVIWFFQLMPAGEIRIIDYEAESNISLASWISIIKDKKYIYGYHLGPHDINVREYCYGQERIKFAEGLGINFTMVPKHNVADGINAVRATLPRCWFDKTKCQHGIEALKSYRKEYSQRLSAFRDRPYHDWASNPADAIRSMAMGLELIKAGNITLKGKTKPDRGGRGGLG